MIFGLTYMEICWYFLLYSFLGWCVEVIFHAVVVGKIINRGFLNGPVCPVYGFGMLGILILLKSLGNTNVDDTNVFVLFTFGTIICSAIELFAGWFLDKVFHARWWDYSDYPFNFHGYICLQFSLFWGVGVVAVIKGVHPLLEKTALNHFMPSVWAWWIIFILYALYLVDLILTVATLIGLNKHLRAIDQASSAIHIVSDTLTEGIGTSAMKADQAADEAKVQVALMKDGIVEQAGITKNNVEDLKNDVVKLTGKAKDEFTSRLEMMKSHIVKYNVLQRMLRAFPNANFYEHNELVNRIREEKRKKASA